jgi:hypothetical protein
VRHSMNTTPARVSFKAHLGQANHFLITTLVALHTLEESDVSSAPAVLHTTWDPKDKSASVNRSRNFVEQSFLGWAVDSIDMYISLLDRKPDCLQNQNLSGRLQDSKVSRSVSKKVRVMVDHFAVSPVSTALVDVLITWRNNIFHQANDNFLQPATRETLGEQSDQIRLTYRGLEIGSLADRAEAGGDLTFKETASLINAAQNFVRELDEHVLSVMNVARYYTEAVQAALNDREQKTGFREKYSRLTLDRRQRFLRTWLRNQHGISEIEISDLDGACNLACGDKKFARPGDASRDQ